MRRKIDFKWLFCLVLGILIGILIEKYSISSQKKNSKVEITIGKDSQVIKKDTLFVHVVAKPSLNEHNLISELKRNKIKHPQIVLAQAKLETASYTSDVCKNHNNLFGLRRGSSYRRYSHWTESIKAYKELIQSRYKGGNYYEFLKKIGYANDPEYINKLKDII